MAEIVRTVTGMQAIALQLRTSGKRIGVVPTMGYLHEGHLSLIKRAKALSDIVITTIFVNPTQFGPNEDLSTYPRDETRDIQIGTAAGTDIFFIPDSQEIYPSAYSTYVIVENVEDVLEGKSRPGHFRGVATVVAKLFNITKPHVAVFGQKDAQQVLVIRRMVKDLNFDLEIVVAPIVREPDGLAMSSRNAYLSPEQRREASVLHRSLELAKELRTQGEIDAAVIKRKMEELITENSTGAIDYISIADPETLEELQEDGGTRSLLVSLAVRFGTTRLIDNMIINA